METLCWSCARSIGKCPWSRDLTPVPGWKAKTREITLKNGEKSVSYFVIKCPLFTADRKSGAVVRKTTIRELAKICDVSLSTVSKWSDERLTEKIRSAGIKADVYTQRLEGDVCKSYFIKIYP